jgi:hypothetical protein
LRNFLGYAYTLTIVWILANIQYISSVHGAPSKFQGIETTEVEEESIENMDAPAVPVATRAVARVENVAQAVATVSSQYMKQALEHLKFHFPSVSVAAIRAIFDHHHHHFTSAFNELLTIGIASTREDIVHRHNCLASAEVIVLTHSRLSRMRRPRFPTQVV